MGQRVFGRRKPRPRCADRLPELSTTDDATRAAGDGNPNGV